MWGRYPSTPLRYGGAKNRYRERRSPRSKGLVVTAGTARTSAQSVDPGPPLALRKNYVHTVRICPPFRPASNHTSRDHDETTPAINDAPASSLSSPAPPPAPGASIYGAGASDPMVRAPCLEHAAKGRTARPGRPSAPNKPPLRQSGCRLRWWWWWWFRCFGALGGMLGWPAGSPPSCWGGWLAGWTAGWLAVRAASPLKASSSHKPVTNTVTNPVTNPSHKPRTIAHSERAASRKEVQATPAATFRDAARAECAIVRGL